MMPLCWNLVVAQKSSSRFLPLHDSEFPLNYNKSMLLFYESGELKLNMRRQSLIVTHPVIRSLSCISPLLDIIAWQSHLKKTKINNIELTHWNPDNHPCPCRNTWRCKSTPLHLHSPPCFLFHDQSKLTYLRKLQISCALILSWFIRSILLKAA